MVNEIIGKEFFKHAEVTLSLNLFAVSADNSLRGIGRYGLHFLLG
jgi:hypothetical protein